MEIVSEWERKLEIEIERKRDDQERYDKRRERKEVREKEIMSKRDRKRGKSFERVKL